MTLFRMLFGRSYIRPETDQDGVHDRGTMRGTKLRPDRNMRKRNRIRWRYRVQTHRIR